VALAICTAWPSAAEAGWPRLPELDRPVISAIKAGEIELWGQFDQMTPSLDFFNYTGKLQSTTKLDLYQSYHLGTRVGLWDRITLDYNVTLSDQNVTRTQEPRKISSRYTGHDLRLQYAFYRSDKVQWALEAGFRSHRAKPLDFFRFDTSSGGVPISVVSLGADPIFSVTSSDNAWLTALRGAYSLQPHIRFDYGVEFRRVTVHTALHSINLADPVIGPGLQARAPAGTLWHENQILAQFGTSWSPLRWFTLAADYTFHAISRNGYTTKAGKIDYNSNHQLDGYLFLHLNEHFTIYGHGRASQRFLLGDLPLLYNTTSNHRFKDPFGFISIGGSYHF